MVALYTFTLTAACLIAITVAIRAELKQRRGDSSRAFTLTLVSMTAFSATLSTLAYAIAGPSDTFLVPLVMGDITMPLAPGLLWATLRSVGPGRQSFAQVALGVSLFVGAVTLSVSPESGQSIKLIVIAVFCVLCVYECVAGELPRPSAWLIGASTGFFGVYCIIRAMGSGDKAVDEAVLGTATSSMLAAVVVVCVTIGVVYIFRWMPGGQAMTTIGVRQFMREARRALARRDTGSLTILTASIPDFALHRAAFGVIWARTLDDALLDAVASVVTPGTIVGTVAPGALAALPAAPISTASAPEGSAPENSTPENSTLEGGAPDGTARDDTTTPALTHEERAARVHEAFIAALADQTPIDIPDIRVQRAVVRNPAELAAVSRRLRLTVRRIPPPQSSALKGASLLYERS